MSVELRPGLLVNLEISAYGLQPGPPWSSDILLFFFNRDFIIITRNENITSFNLKTN